MPLCVGGALACLGPSPNHRDELESSVLHAVILLYGVVVLQDALDWGLSYIAAALHVLASPCDRAHGPATPTMLGHLLEWRRVACSVDEALPPALWCYRVP